MADKMMRMAGRGEDGTAKAIKTTNEGVIQTQVTGSFFATAPITGIKKITSVPSEVYAGETPKFLRRKLVIKNEDSVLRIRVGENKSDLQQQGFPVEPGAVVEFPFEFGTNVRLFAVSEGVGVNIAVMEV